MINPKEVPVGVSGRHVHLSQVDLETLFGTGYQLTPQKPLRQPGQYACAETVNLVGAKRTMPNVRILGPIRKATQVEISRSDSFVLGIQPPIRESGDIAGSGGLTVEGPAGKVILTEGVIIAKRHLHLETAEAEALGLQDKQVIAMRAGGPRGLTFNEVVVRVHPEFRMELHLDQDEANAAWLGNGDLLEIVEK